MKKNIVALYFLFTVSRVGSSAQTKSMKHVSGRMKLDLAQYREMSVFSQFSSDLDETTKKFLDKGDRLVELLKQPPFDPLSNEEQVASIFIGVHDYLDSLDVSEVQPFEMFYLRKLRQERTDILDLFASEATLSSEQTHILDSFIQEQLTAWRQDHPSPKQA